MISFTSKQRYYFCSFSMDMRKDIDTISEVVRSQMGLDPFLDEYVFIFMSKTLRTMKILYNANINILIANMTNEKH
ncbi:IS66 family insertion sequence element accessory protein TnpB [Prevotella sp.]|uniref:IS66 family insertion sequence element accessory protein TnpB n=1 Tax=Prevotella sp. TaxID=59823 RepID=UPI0035AE385F